MSADAKVQVLETVEATTGSKRKVLAELGVSKSDCYRWRASWSLRSARPRGWWPPDSSRVRWGSLSPPPSIWNVWPGGTWTPYRFTRNLVAASGPLRPSCCSFC